MTAKSPVLALAALLAAGCATPDLPSSFEPLPLVASAGHEPFVLGPNDVVRATVYGHPELSTPLEAGIAGTAIDPEGLLSLPLVGAVPIAGLTLSEARERIAAEYASFLQEPRLDVSVVEYAARRFYLYGQVREPGAYVIDRPLTAYQALALGGGFTNNADRDEVVLLRDLGDRVEVHVIDGATPDPSGFVRIRPDDFLFVRRTGTGRFAEEVLPILQGISSSLGSVATVLLIEDRIEEDD